MQMQATADTQNHRFTNRKKELSIHAANEELSIHAAIPKR
jgi:hypothetical protein